MKTRFAKSLVLLLAAIMAAVALPIYAGAESIGFEDKISSETATKGYLWQPPYPEPKYGTVLSIDSSGKYVRWLQECLNWLGFDCGTVDGWYGDNTENGVRAFQRSYQLDVDGIFGPQTHAMIRACLMPGSWIYRVSASSGVKMRSVLGTSYSIVGTIPKGTVITVTQINGNWGKTTYNGKTGWVFLNDCAQIIPTTSWRYRVSTPSGVKMRSAAGTSYSIVGAIPNGTVITVTQKGGNWGKTTYNGKTGWVFLNDCAPIIPRWTHRVSTPSGVNMRSGPGTSYSIVDAIPDGTLITVTQTSGNWGKTTYNGKTGWVCLDYCTKL